MTEWTMQKCGCGRCNSYEIATPLNIDGKFEKSDAEYIVRACNSLDELVAACEGVLALYEDDVELPQHSVPIASPWVDAILAIKAAIALAKGE